MGKKGLEYEDTRSGNRGHEGGGIQSSAGNIADAQVGRLLLETVWPLERTVPLLMDRAYEDDRVGLR